MRRERIIDCRACKVRLGGAWHGLCLNCYRWAYRASQRRGLSIEAAVELRVARKKEARCSTSRSSD